MAAPTTTARSTPTGIKLDDGFSTTIAFALDPDVNLWEKTVTPPGVDGGDAIDVTTMHNDTWLTFRPQALLTLTEASFTAAYDPNLYDQILALVNIDGAITVHFPDMSTLDFFGYLRVFEPQEISRGEQPEANVTIQPTNWDPDNNVEEAPVMTPTPGT